MSLRFELYRINQRLKRRIKQGFKPYYKVSPPYWVQEMNIKSIGNRLDLIVPLCQGKEVLHFGCTDWPIFNSKTNLHIKLDPITKSLHGFDIDLEGIEVLKKYVDQPYFSSYEGLYNYKYDICLVPETIEHVDNVKEFLVNVSKVNADQFLITGPNCFSRRRRKNYWYNKTKFVELNHPDHNYWFSPYTLKNVIEKYTDLEVRQIYLLDDERMVGCLAAKKN